MLLTSLPLEVFFGQSLPPPAENILGLAGPPTPRRVRRLESAPTIDRDSRQAEPVPRTTFDEQQNVVADHALRQVLVGIFDGGSDQARRQLRELAHKASCDLIQQFSLSPVGPVGPLGRGASTYIDR